MTPLKLYRPSNGTEGEIFQFKWCERCRKDTPNRPCGILSRSVAFDVEDADYPREWKYVEGSPTCTAFEEKKEREPVVRSHKPGKDQQSMF